MNRSKGQFTKGQKDGNRNEYNRPKSKGLWDSLFPSKETQAKRKTYDKGYQNGQKQRDQRRKTR